MEEYKKKLLKAQDGDEDAIRELGVSRIPPELEDRSPSLTWRTLKSDFKEIVAISFAATILGHTFLQETTTKLLSMFVYVAKIKFKKQIKVTPTVDRVLDNCPEMVASWQTFLGKIGNKDGEKVMGQLHSIIADCQNGDPDAITFLGLDQEQAEISIDEMRKVPHFTRLSSDFLAFLLMAIVGQHMSEKSSERVGVLMCSYLKWVASEAYKDRSLEPPLDDDFIFGSLSNEVEELTQMATKYEVSVRHLHIKRNEESCLDIEQQLEDPNFVPPTDSDNSLSEEGDSSINEISLEHPKKRKKNTISPTEVQPDLTEKPLIPTLTVSHRIGWKRSPTPSCSQDSKPRPKVKRTSATSKRSHHAIHECPVCHKQEGNLKRHLLTHAKQGLIPEKHVSKLLSIAVRQEKERGPSKIEHEVVHKGLRMKRCPIKGCDYVTAYMRSHLTHKHRLKAGVVLEKYLSVAKKYKGRSELKKVAQKISSRASPSEDDEDKAPTRKRRCVIISIGSPSPKSTSPPPSTCRHPRSTTSTSTCYSTMLSAPTTPQAAPPLPCMSFNKAASSLSSEDDEDSGDDGPSAFFSVEKPSNNRHWWLLAFYQYLALPDCGRKKSRNRMQNAACKSHPYDPRISGPKRR